MSKPTNTDLVPFLNGTARVTATSATDVSIVSDETQRLNGIEIEFRIHVVKSQYGNGWRCTNIFAYRQDAQHQSHPNHPATDNQKQKLYRAAIEVVEGLSKSFLLQGALAEATHELDRAQGEVEDAEIRRYEAQVKVQALKSEMAS